MNPYSPPFFPSSTLLPPFHHHFPFILPTPYLYPSRIYFVPSQFGVTSSLQLLPPVKPEAQPACPPQKRRDVKRRDLSNPCANKKRSDIRNVPTRHFDFTRRGCHGWKTSVMIKNIPSKYTKEMLLSLLDKHCSLENQSLSGVSVHSEFDFFYLPMDFRSGYNLGYAFVNFTSPEAAWRLHAFLHKKSWDFFCSRKICEVTFARIQGLDALKMNFVNSKFHCNSDQFLPVEFFPPRNGTNFNVKSRFIGKRISS
ncbi:hypothetical protein ZOSMA_48G00530 [Zostera marina]|uniref:RRM domain-containing protein n=1 Tax=Zostera marina TaxID=29655 RepID=A0A0K9NZJ8_ZOSMR|nr:hypothetical protein ZOSMA_48G00530 [Zostera marina]